MKTILSPLLAILSFSLVAQHLEVEGEIDMKGNKIFNVADPTNDQDVVTKAYVDLLEKRIADLEFDISYILGLDSIFDVQGNSYKIVKIGDQYWMSENLRTTSYNDGTPILKVEDYGEWMALNSPAYCWYDNDSTIYANQYGSLYNYFTVADTNTRNICPIGWDAPTLDEWTVLKDYLIDNGYGYGGSGYDIGKSMAFKSGWTTYGTPGTIGNDQETNNSSGFSGLPGGYRNSNGISNDVGHYGIWWSSTKYTDTDSWNSILFYINDFLNQYSNGKQFGYSVRCLKD